MGFDARPKMRAVNLDQVVHHGAEEVRAADHAVEPVAAAGDPDVRRTEGRDPVRSVARGRFPGNRLAAFSDEERAVLFAHVDEVRDAHEVEDERIDRLLEDFPGRADLLDRAFGVHDGHAVGNGEADFLVVGDVKHRDAELPLQFLNLEAHFLAQVRVQV